VRKTGPVTTIRLLYEVVQPGPRSAQEKLYGTVPAQDHGRPRKSINYSRRRGCNILLWCCASWNRTPSIASGPVCQIQIADGPAWSFRDWMIANRSRITQPAHKQTVGYLITGWHSQQVQRRIKPADSNCSINTFEDGRTPAFSCCTIGL